MPSPSPSPSPIPEETYKFHGPDGNVCIHMKAGLEVKVNYTTENGVCGYVYKKEIVLIFVFEFSADKLG